MSKPIKQLLSGFWPMVIVQFQGAFSDNFVKMMFMLYGMSLFHNNERMLSMNTTIASALLPIAFLLFSGWAGVLSDKYSKHKIFLATKLAELGIMLLLLGVWLDASIEGTPRFHTYIFSLCICFMMFTHSAFFSPSKYGIIPELVPETRIAWANGVIGLTTFLAIIFGLAAATLIYSHLSWNKLFLLPLCMVFLSIIGLLFIHKLPMTRPANPDKPLRWNFLPQLYGYMRIIKKNRTLWLTAWGLAHFWGIGTVLLTHVMNWSKLTLKLEDQNAGLLFVLTAFGVGIGSIAAGIISRRRIEIGLTPLACIGMIIFSIPLAFATPQRVIPMSIFLFLVGACAGMFSVPLNALMQSRAKTEDRAGVIAGASYISDSCILLALGIYYLLLTSPKISHNAIFLFIAAFNLIVLIIVFWRIPVVLIYMISFLATHFYFRLGRKGDDRLPDQTASLFVVNRLGLFEAFIFTSLSRRNGSMIIHERFVTNKYLKKLFTSAGCLWINDDANSPQTLKAFEQANLMIDEGRPIYIAEGRINLDQPDAPAIHGWQRLVHENTPIIPAAIYCRSKRDVMVTFGEPYEVPPSTEEMRMAVAETSIEASETNLHTRPLVHHSFVKMARSHWRQQHTMDSLTPTPLTFGQTLYRSVILARRLRSFWKDQQTIGIMLPPANGSLLANYAATLSGRAVVNLNYTAGQEIIDLCAQKSGLKTIITAELFLKRVNLTSPVEPIFLETMQGFRGVFELVGAIIAARFFPLRWLESYCGAQTHPTLKTPATIIFSSGSTGIPKGVVLTHQNIAANIEQFHQVIRIETYDRLLNVLPFFHSFGYTVSIWGSTHFPFSVVHHTNPLDIKTVGEICEKFQATVIVNTPTFIQHYIKRLPKEQLQSINCVITGAEKLPDRIQKLWTEHFGFNILQGYGLTESSPVVAVNLDAKRERGNYPLPSKLGSVGRPVPGTAARIVHQETGQPCAVGEQGLLLVKGLNVMAGYFDSPQLTAQTVVDGWLHTNDMAYIDEDGFIFITDRIARFSKIAGEMVPHALIEDKLHELLGYDTRVLAVCSAADPERGEQLVVIYTDPPQEETSEPLSIETLSSRLAEHGLPNLWIPKKGMYFKVEQLPLLGTGKLDLSKLKKMAATLVGQ